jgi:hypothetical protein
LSTDRLVNRFIGYGLASVIEKFNADLKEADDKGDDEFAETVKKQQTMIRKMRIFHEEAIQIDGYMEKNCCPHLALRNNGYLALVSPSFFEFGRCVMDIISKNTEITIFRKHGKDCYEKAEDSIWQNKKEMLLIFEKCCVKKENIEVTDNVSKKEKEDIVVRIVNKAFHAYYGSQQHIFQQETVNRKGTDCVYGPFRQHLSSICAKKDKVIKNHTNNNASNRASDSE